MNKVSTVRQTIWSTLTSKKCLHQKPNEVIKISRSVTEAICERKPMVALESTVLTHGMPWPINYRTAQELEEILVKENVVPVTIGIFHNSIKAGFSTDEMEELAKCNTLGERPTKVSRRDMYNVRNIKYGGTTVAGTMIIAKKLGIKVFATGGIGGVHRDSDRTMDISADLRELGRTPVCVISSGVKSFLDIPKTLEYLETEGVFVATLFAKDFPGFFLKSSGLKSPCVIESVDEAAHLIHSMSQLDISSGILLAVSIPDHLEEEGVLINDAIERSIQLSKEMKISGSELTPFVLKKVNELTKGRSLQLNVELIKNNAMIGGKIAAQLRNIERACPRNSKKEDKSAFVVIGGSVVDNNLKFRDPNVKSLTNIVEQASYDCTCTQICGGVARNMAEAFSSLGEKCVFLSAIGNDLSADFLRKNSQSVDWTRVRVVDDFETSSCSVIVAPHNGILFHIGNFEMKKFISKEYVKENLLSINSKLKLICCDCNLTMETLTFVIDFAKSHDITVFLEPTDILLAHKCIDATVTSRRFKNPIDIVSPNLDEFLHLYNLMSLNQDQYNFKIWKNCRSKGSLFEKIKEIMTNTNILDLIPYWIIKLGPAGVIFASKEETFLMKQSIFLTKKRDIVSASGAGDCLAACSLFLRFKEGLSWQDSLAGGVLMAKESLESHRTVPLSTDINKYTKSSLQRWNKEMKDNKLLVFVK